METFQLQSENVHVSIRLLCPISTCPRFAPGLKANLFSIIYRSMLLNSLGRKLWLTFSALFYTVSNINEFQVDFLSRSLPEAKPFEILAGFKHRILAVQRTRFVSSTAFDSCLVALCAARDKILHRFQALVITGLFSEQSCELFFVSSSADSKSKLCKLINNSSSHIQQISNILWFLGNLRSNRTGCRPPVLNRMSNVSMLLGNFPQIGEFTSKIEFQFRSNRISPQNFFSL